MSVACPNCGDSMSEEALDAQFAPQSVETASCASCSLFWFDQTSSVRLAPRAVLGLFESIGKSATGARTPLKSNFNCPRCANVLAYTHDLQRTTRFNYWRCPLDRGQLITYDQFLREKSFIRTPSAAEIAKLRDTVRQISCSQCGAPIDLATDNACTHCGAAIALIDPDGVAKALQGLATGAALTSPGSEATVSAALSDAQISAIFDAQRINDHEGEHDLVAIGAAAIGGILGALLLSR